MANDKVIHLNDPATFDEETKDGYALVDFWAGWCAPGPGTEVVVYLHVWVCCFIACVCSVVFFLGLACRCM